MIFKVDFEKAFDFVRWDYLDDVLKSFGFGDKWRGWIRGCLNSSIGITIDESLISSHLFYADDAVFIGEWDTSDINIIVKVLKCCYMALGLKINIQKSKLMGFGVHSDEVTSITRLVGCSTFPAPFNYLGVKVGGHLTLLKLVRSSISLYHMSIFKVPIRVLNHLESIRKNFFNDIGGSSRKMTWISWNKVLASKKKGGLGVSSFFTTNREKSLKYQFPRLYALEKCKLIMVAEKIRHDGLSSSYRHPLRGGAEEDQQSLLQAHVTKLVLPQMLDRWTWSLDSSGDFLVKSLPTRLDLSLRGVDISISSIVCPLCDASVESSSHIFFTCPLVCQVRSKVSRWWELDDPVLHSYDGWLTWFNNIRLSKNLKALFEKAARYKAVVWLGRSTTVSVVVIVVDSVAGGRWSNLIVPAIGVVRKRVPNSNGRLGISSLMKCTSAIRQMAYGAVPDALDEYLQMGALTARKSLQLFCKAIMELYGEAFLRKPTYTAWKNSAYH
ncbi:hypothetical protein Tco_1290599 [Tanacetum coccineum]